MTHFEKCREEGVTEERNHKSLLQGAQIALQDIIKTTTHRSALDALTKALAEVRFAQGSLQGLWLNGTVVPIAKHELNCREKT